MVRKNGSCSSTNQQVIFILTSVYKSTPFKDFPGLVHVCSGHCALLRTNNRDGIFSWAKHGKVVVKNRPPLPIHAIIHIHVYMFNGPNQEPTQEDKNFVLHRMTSFLSSGPMVRGPKWRPNLTAVAT
jgi:hypothetical protein